MFLYLFLIPQREFLIAYKLKLPEKKLNCYRFLYFHHYQNSMPIDYKKCNFLNYPKIIYYCHDFSWKYICTRCSYLTIHILIILYTCSVLLLSKPACACKIGKIYILSVRMLKYEKKTACFCIVTISFTCLKSATVLINSLLRTFLFCFVFYLRQLCNNKSINYIS